MLRTGMKARSGYLAEVTGKSPKFASAVLSVHGPPSCAPGMEPW